MVVSTKDEKTFGQRLRDTRIKSGLSQSDLEEISGIPKARLSRYENGHVAPSIHTLERLAGALKVSEASLLGDQRAILEEFFQVLTDRGVRIATSEQGRALGHAVADVYLAMCGGPDGDAEVGGAGRVRGDAGDVDLSSAELASVHAWEFDPN